MPPPASRYATACPGRGTGGFVSVLHIMAIVQIRHDTEGRAYYRRKLAAGKTPMEALRCLKRRLSDVVYRQLAADMLQAGQPSPDSQHEADPGGHVGAALQSSAAGLNPIADTSDQSLPGPATHHATPTRRARRTPSLT